MRTPKIAVPVCAANSEACSTVPSPPTHTSTSDVARRAQNSALPSPSPGSGSMSTHEVRPAR